MINSPGNPTGGVIPLETLEHIADVAKKRDIWVLSDEVYSRLVYGPAPTSIATLPGMMDRTIICDGFSKTFSMTGWRLGYGIMPPALAQRVDLLLNHSIGCTANFTQHAGVEAIRGDQEQVEEVVEVYRQRRDMLIPGLNEIPGVSCRTPQGAFYAFPNVSALGHSSDWLADYLLDEAGVALLPGTAFGQYGEGYLRLSFANSLANIQLALGKLSEAIKKLSARFDGDSVPTNKNPFARFPVIITDDLSPQFKILHGGTMPGNLPGDPGVPADALAFW